MPTFAYIVHKKSHKLHIIGGCGFSTDYSTAKYDQYHTLHEAYVAHGAKTDPCRFCSVEHNLNNPSNN